MKYFYFLIILFFLSSININAQEDVITNLDRPVGLVFNGNDLYFTEANIGKISKIDITEATPTAVAVASGLSSPYTLALNGNDLYIAENTANKISKIDITAGGTSIDVVTGLSAPYGLALNGNDLYISLLSGSSGKIIKIDITATTPAASDVFILTTGVFATAIAFNGNYLYMGLQTKISKIDITETTPTLTDVVTGLSVPNGLAFNGNDLYIAEYTANKISKIDITAGGTSTDVVTGLFGPEGLALNGNELYIAEIPANKISKIDIGATAGIDDQNQLDISIYPNPTSDMVYIGGNYTQLKVVIYNILGKEVINKSITNSIDISHLENGVYLMKLSDGVKLYTRKVIKN